jgi:hypothetical protein
MRIPRKLKKKVKKIPKNTYYCYNWKDPFNPSLGCNYCPYHGWNKKDKYGTCTFLGIYEWDMCISDSVKQCRWGLPKEN